MMGLDGAGKRLSQSAFRRPAPARRHCARLVVPAAHPADGQTLRGLDEITRDRLNEEMLSLWQATKMTILFVTHSIMEATYLGERVLVLASNPGRLRRDFVDLSSVRRKPLRAASPTSRPSSKLWDI